MAISYNYNVKCNCGHIGRIKHRENDTPLSGSFWNHYTLEDLVGSDHRGEIPLSDEQIFSEMDIYCPRCKSKLSKHNMSGV